VTVVVPRELPEECEGFAREAVECVGHNVVRATLYGENHQPIQCRFTSLSPPGGPTPASRLPRRWRSADRLACAKKSNERRSACILYLRESAGLGAAVVLTDRDMLYPPVSPAARDCVGSPACRAARSLDYTEGAVAVRERWTCSFTTCVTPPVDSGARRASRSWPFSRSHSASARTQRSSASSTP